MTTRQDVLQLLTHRLIEVDTSPDFTASKPIVIFKKEEIGKLLRQFEIMKEKWIALKYTDSIFIVWRKMVFLYLEKSPNDDSLAVK